MQKNNLILSVLIFFTFFVIQPVAADANKIAAVVNGEKITLDEVNMAVKGLAQYRELQNYVLENIVVSTLIYQESKKAGVEVDPKEVEKGFQEYLKIFPDGATIDKELKKYNITKEELKSEIAKKLMVKQFVEKRAVDLKLTVTDDEAKAYFEAQPDVFNQPERIRTSHILLKCGPGEPAEKAAKIKAQMQALKKRISEGEYLADLAREYSEDSSKSKGGDIGFISRNSPLDKEFINTVFDLKVGEISGVVKSVYGYHLITVTEKKAAMRFSFSEIKERIKSEILKQKNDAALKDYVKTLTDKSNIEIFLGKSR